MPSKADFDSSSAYSKELIKNTHHFFEFEFAAKAFSIAAWFTFPVQIMMIVIGYMYKNECPAEPRLARFLFFCGTAGTMVIMLRLITYIQWKRLQRQYGRFDANTHPGLSLVQAMTYVFVVFVVCLFVDATRFVFTIYPDLEHPESERFCHPNAYYVVYVLVIVFDIIFGVIFLLWLTAMVLGVCNPDFLVMYGYFLDESEMKFNVREKIRKRRKKHSKEYLMATAAAAFASKRSTLDSDEEKGPTPTSNTPEKRIYKEPKSHHYQAIKSDEINPKSKLKSPKGSRDTLDEITKGENGKPARPNGRFNLAPPAPEEEGSPMSSRFKIKPVKVKPNPVYGVEPLKDTSFEKGGGGGGNNKTRLAKLKIKPSDFSDFEDNLDGYDEDDKSNLSIVRFSSAVNSRRISVDFVNENRLDITKFPSGPLSRQNSNSEKLDSEDVAEADEEAEDDDDLT